MINKSSSDLPQDPRRAQDPVAVDLARRLNTPQPEDLIEVEAQKLAKISIKANGYVPLTASLFKAAGLVGVRREHSRRGAGALAHLQRSSSGLEVVVSSVLEPRDVRFAVAHEIGHLLWLADRGELGALSPLQSRLNSDARVESLCNRFAAALLMPRDTVLEWLDQVEPAWRQQPICLHLIAPLATHFGTPERAVTRRLFFEMHSLRIAVVCARKSRRGPGLGPNGVSGWELSWAATPDFPRNCLDGSGFSLVGHSSRRRIPEGWIPAPMGGGTESHSTMAPWRKLFEPMPKKQARLPLSKWATNDCSEIFMAQVSAERILIGVPL